MTSDQDNGQNGPPKRLGQEPQRLLPKRFYTDVTVELREGAFVVLLDGRVVRTPRKATLALPGDALARAVADEWNAQGERVDPASMPMTRLANTAIDAVASRMPEVADDIVAFSGSDLLCYRAEGPAGLVRRQSEAWDPVLAWARRDLGAEFHLREGVMPIEQPAETLSAIGRALDGYDAISLAALHVMTTISGSALLALACARRHLSSAEAWEASTVDEAWQREQWGVDAEAEAASRFKRSEFEAASRCVLLRDPQR